MEGIFLNELLLRKNRIFMSFIGTIFFVFAQSMFLNNTAPHVPSVYLMYFEFVLIDHFFFGFVDYSKKRNLLNYLCMPINRKDIICSLFMFDLIFYLVIKVVYISIFYLLNYDIEILVLMIYSTPLVFGAFLIVAYERYVKDKKGIDLLSMIIVGIIIIICGVYILQLNLVYYAIYTIVTVILCALFHIKKGIVCINEYEI